MTASSWGDVVEDLLLVREDETVCAIAGPGAVAEVVAQDGAFTQELRVASRPGPAVERQPNRTAGMVRVRDRPTVITDGPFAESRERLGGCWAARVPGASNGAIEVWPPAVGPIQG